jgi:hypothetical protein
MSNAKLGIFGENIIFGLTLVMNDEHDTAAKASVALELTD